LGVLPTPTALRSYTAWIERAVPIASALATTCSDATASAPATADHNCAAAHPDAATYSDTASGTGAASAAATIATKAIGGVAKPNDTIAVHQLTVSATAAGAVSIQGSVVFHILCLTGFAIHLNVVNLYIATGSVVIVLNVDIARSRTVVNIILVAGT
jgi:hypothetical protein